MALWGRSVRRAIAGFRGSVVCGQKSSVTSFREAHIYSRDAKSGLAPDQQCPPFRAPEMEQSVSFLAANLHSDTHIQLHERLRKGRRDVT